MKTVIALLFAFLAAVVGTAASVAVAASSPVPAVVITSPRDGAVIHGNHIRVTVAVSNFTVVAPQGAAHRGNQGHVHYVLDDVSTFSADAAGTSSLSHTWTHIRPGRHTLVAYLATSRHLPFSHAKFARVSVTVRPKLVPTPRPRPTAGSRSLGVGRAPITGGAASAPPPVKRGARFNLDLLLAALFAFVVGLIFLGRRYTFVTTGTSISARGPASNLTASEHATPAGSGAGASPFLHDSSSTVATMTFRDHGDPMPSDPGPAREEATHRDEEPPAPSSGVGGFEITRARAMEMSQQWSTMVQDLLRELDRQEVDRQQMLSKISALEGAVNAHESLKQALEDATHDALTREDLLAVQYVTDSLMQDPDHIVVLASVAQHADKLARLVKNYARIHRALSE